MKPQFTKGAPLSANDLNALADIACQNIIGGTGCAVTHIGKRTIVSERVNQIIPKGRIGNVWRINTDLSISWMYDTKHDSASHLGVDDTYCYVYARDSGVGLTSPHGIHQFTVGGTKNWTIDSADANVGNADVVDLRQQLLTTIGGNLIAVGNFTDGDIVKKFDAADGTELSSIAGGLNLGVSFGARSDGTYVWFFSRNTSPAINWLRRIDASLSLTSYADGTGTTKGVVQTPSAVLPTTNGIFVATHGQDGWGTYETAVKLDTSPTFVWSTPFYASPDSQALRAIDVVHEGGNTYWVGDLSGAMPACVWKLDSSGNLVWSVDLGGAGASSIAIIGSHIYVSAHVRSNTWPGATGYANVWKLDLDGNIIASLDFGVRVSNEALDVRVMRLRANSTHLFAITDRAERP